MDRFAAFAFAGRFLPFVTKHFPVALARGVLKAVMSGVGLPPLWELGSMNHYGSIVQVLWFWNWQWCVESCMSPPVHSHEMHPLWGTWDMGDIGHSLGCEKLARSLSFSLLTWSAINYNQPRGNAFCTTNALKNLEDISEGSGTCIGSRSSCSAQAINEQIQKQRVQSHYITVLSNLHIRNRQKGFRQESPRPYSFAFYQFAVESPPGRNNVGYAMAKTATSHFRDLRDR